jgi:hypothetical protein
VKGIGDSGKDVGQNLKNKTRGKREDTYLRQENKGHKQKYHQNSMNTHLYYKVHFAKR